MPPLSAPSSTPCSISPRALRPLYANSGMSILELVTDAHRFRCRGLAGHHQRYRMPAQRFAGHLLTRDAVEIGRVDPICGVGDLLGHFEHLVYADPPAEAGAVAVRAAAPVQIRVR